MTVILGKLDRETVTLAADKRAVKKDGEILSDDHDKIYCVNSHLAIATAGSGLVATLIKIECEKNDERHNLVVEDIIDMIDYFYKTIPQVKEMPFKCIIGGKNKENKIVLVSGIKVKTTFHSEIVPVAIHNPIDMTLDVCNQIYATNYRNDKAKYIEKTIYDISEKSRMVSSKGNMWVYNINSDKSRKYDL